MAHKIVPFYNVDSGVGENSPNKPDDVALVRFFLRRIGDAPDVNIPSLSSLQITTSPGADLNHAIRDFQIAVKNHGNHCAQDGRVDTAQNIGHGSLSTITHTAYTIAHLNASYRRRYATLHNDLTKDSKLPAILAPKFASPLNGY